MQARVFGRYNTVNDADVAEAARKSEAGANIKIPPQVKQEAAAEVAVQ